MNDTVKAWEYPEDDWISMGDSFDMNMWTDDIDGKMRISIYAVRNGQTDAVFPLSNPFKQTRTCTWQWCMGMFGARFALFVRRARVLPSPFHATRNL